MEYIKVTKQWVAPIAQMVISNKQELIREKIRWQLVMQGGTMASHNMVIASREKPSVGPMKGHSLGANYIAMELLERVYLKALVDCSSEIQILK